MTRPPRYRFPNEVRDATREAASRMMRDGTVVTTPEELETWLAGAPEVRASLESGGYGTAFDENDLFPLLQAMTGQQQVPASTPTPDRLSSPAFGRWVATGVILIVIIVVVLIALGVDVLP